MRHFILVLDPPVDDGHKDDDRLEALMLKSLLGQAQTLWTSLKRKQTLGVITATASKGGLDKEVTASRVLCAIGQDLSDFPGFNKWKEQLLLPAPTTYTWPTPPDSSCYVLKRKI